MGITTLADELYKIGDSLPGKRIELNRMSTDSSAGGLVDTIFAACDKAGVDCPINNTHPNSPAERGPMIYIKEPNNPPGCS
jgi:hypothetical protein